ncbi:ABC transporter ATP-binding protein [Methylocapsa palsarum]|uniref:NitT/TauT family transport system ATP-binding protein n=1 Tax=Methylocapsa palsarum TaxID=1612308 RepID=A0A1I4ARJ9_9HYPH|nr:ABC transporter ATP-binding protein [Methylocapsa palsarum]SFK58994.1 NitT/TauT family transport system ATP-binding protein [Methylocapsa palsarum]
MPAVAEQGGSAPAVGRLEIHDLSIRFGTNPVIENFGLTVEPGEFVCLLGPSGCGKSTVLNAVAGFVPVESVTVSVDGRPVKGPGVDRGMVFQQYSLFPWKTVLENVAFGPRMQGASRAKARSMARTYLEFVGLLAFADRYPATLSGGMQQRVGIARALVNHPSVLLMDEPFGALDAQTRGLMQENLLRLWEEIRATVLFVTHDIDEALYLADRVVIMSAPPGRVLLNLAIDLPRPRPDDVFALPAFAAAKRQCLTLIRQESQRVFDHQRRNFS